jgi:hypothetical protein
VLHYGFTTGGVTLACGGLSALQQAVYVRPAQPTKPDFDLIHTIRTNFKRSNATEQGSASNLPEHRHLFTKKLEDRLTGVILDKQNWLDFMDMVQRKAYAHRQHHQESKRPF